MKYLLLLIIIGFGFFLFGCIETGEASVTDTVANVEHQGLVWKTTEMYLTNDHDTFYCLQDSKLIEKAKKLSETKGKATIYYKINMFFFPWDCGGGSDKYSNGGLVTDIIEKG
jgi:hypothetical protein